MEKVIVTGGTGFIGSHLAEELVSKGYYVTILDDLSIGKMDNIQGLLSKKNVDFVQGSVINFPLLLELFQNTKYVFHQAAIPSVPRSIASPSASHDVNITGTLNVLLSARDNHVNKVIYASSSSVYGDTPTLPKREDMLPSPLSPYAVTKLAGEYYCRAFHQVYGLPTVCLRLTMKQPSANSGRLFSGQEGNRPNFLISTTCHRKPNWCRYKFSTLNTAVHYLAGCTTLTAKQ